MTIKPPGAEAKSSIVNGAIVNGCRGVGSTVDQRSPKPRVGVRIPPPLPDESMATMAKEATESVSGAVEAVKNWPQRVKNFIDGLRTEMHRVTWPSSKQVRATTLVVIITVFLFGAFFAAVDTALNYGTSRLFNYFTK